MKVKVFGIDGTETVGTLKVGSPGWIEEMGSFMNLDTWVRGFHIRISKKAMKEKGLDSREVELYSGDTIKVVR